MNAPSTALREVARPGTAVPLRVLLVEDSALDTQLVAAKLDEAGLYFDLTRVDNEQGLVRALSQGRFDVVLSDYNVPGFDGLTAMAVVRRLAPETPFIFVSGALGEDRAIELLKRGATDYILKDRLERLVPSVERALREAREREELKRAEAERQRLMQLAQAERERLHALFFQAPAAICMVAGRAHEIVLANPQFQKLLPAQQLVGRPYQDVAPAWAGQDHFHLLERAFVTGELQSLNEVPIPWFGSPSERHFNFCFQPTRDIAGVIDGVLIHAVDVTETVLARQKVEELAAELQRKEARASALIASLVEGVLVQDTNGIIQQCNASAERILDAQPGELIGQTPRNAVSLSMVQEDGSPWDPENLPSAVVLRTGEPQVGKVMGITRSDGQRVWLAVNAQPLYEPGATALQGVVTSFFDLTERKALEAEMQSRTDFEQLLVGIVSHDLRNPLGAIRMTAQLIMRNAARDERVSRHALRILSSSDRATRLIGDLLDFTQARLGGGIRVQRSEVDLHVVAQETIDEIRAAWPGREVRLMQDGDGVGRWDADRLSQVIQNLTTNALRYSPPESVVLVSTRGDGESVSLEVHNEGQPIPAELLPQLFTAMKRGTQDVDRQSRSVGLGLFIVQQVVKAHGGQVAVHSTTDAGTRFTVRLPRD